MKPIVMQVVGYCTLFCTTLIANFNCQFLLHQEEEPEAVRKLRKF